MRSRYVEASLDAEDVNPLEAVPLEQFRTTTALHKVRWPQILTEVTRKRESMRKIAAEVSDRGK